VNNSLRLENPSLECELVEAECGDLVFMAESFWINYPQSGQAKSENNVDINAPRSLWTVLVRCETNEAERCFLVYISVFQQAEKRAGCQQRKPSKQKRVSAVVAGT
jgi:hypothetical protein